MAITLTKDATTLGLPEDLFWIDEFSWARVAQETTRSTTGALLVDVAVKQAGQPITLEGTDTNAWITRALCSTLQAWAALPGIELALVLRGETHQVIFDHAKGGFSAQPIWKLLDGEITPELMYRPTFKFLKV